MVFYMFNFLFLWLSTSVSFWVAECAISLIGNWACIFLQLESDGINMGNQGAKFSTALTRAAGRREPGETSLHVVVLGSAAQCK